MKRFPNTRERCVLVIILLATLPGIVLGAGAVPRLEVDLEKTLTLDFADATVRTIYEALGENAGVQFVFHDKVDLERQTSLSLSDISLREALGVVTDKLGNFHVARGPRTLFVAPDSRPMRQAYTPQAIQVFHLSHADTKGIITVLRSLLQTRQIAEDPRLNAITIRDSIENVEIAKSLIEVLDREGAEVLVDLELIEISRTGLQAIAAHSPNGASASTATAEQGDAEPSGRNQDELARRIRTSEGSESIAGPRLRVVAGERGSVFIGERVALPSATLDSSESEQTASGDDAIPYEDVGIRIEVDPRVHEGKKGTLRLAIEMSSLSPEESSDSATARQPVIGRHTVETTMTLEDGETQVLTGLVPPKAGAAGLSPTDTELVLLVTMHVSRAPDVRPNDQLPLWVGTE